jgi:hypothetical protein
VQYLIELDIGQIFHSLSVYIFSECVRRTKLSRIPPDQRPGTSVLRCRTCIIVESGAYRALTGIRHVKSEIRHPSLGAYVKYVAYNSQWLVYAAENRLGL